MAGIPLRAYIQEIEKQIESGRIDEAIAHCRHILQTYPKYVDVYRLLGKAYLEIQRYGDAGDIFQRVLSAIPDDFVSHVGMSIIREDEGNLDEAIWHMERAFEVQPANAAIQDELRRLFEKRDGVEPPKIRLSRGALARMYAKGDLYQQAIGEIRAALAESPDRLDLQVLLASVYARAGQRVEAIEIANSVLRKLPNSMVASQILSEVLVGSDREVEVIGHRKHLVQLDPYAAFLSEEYPTLESVSIHAITLPKLEWKPGETPASIPAGPAWATSLGVDIGELSPAKESLPDWLSSMETEEGAPEEAAPSLEEPGIPGLSEAEEEQVPEWMAGEEQPEAPPQTPEEIPDWMKSAGWEPSSGVGEAEEAAFQFEETAQMPPEAVEEGDLAPAEIPDWMRAMAPGQAEEAEVPPDRATLDWLDKVIPAEPPAVSAAAEAEQPPAIEPAAEEEMGGPGWVGAAAAAAVAGAAFSEFSERAGGEETPPAEEIPEEIAGEAEISAAIAAGQALEWTGEELPSAELQPEELPAEEPLVWEMEAEAPPSEAEQVEPTVELPAWMMEGEEEPVSTGEAVEAISAPAEEFPSWPSPVETEEVEGLGLESAAGIAAASQIPEWMSSEEEPVSTGEAVEQISAPAEEFPSWPSPVETEEVEGLGLESAAGIAAASQIPEWMPSEEEIAEVEPLPGQDIPDWLVESRLEPSSEKPMEEEIPDWLAELEGETSETKPEPGEEVPDWLKDARVERFKTTPVDRGPEWLEFPEEQPAEGLPEWLSEAEVPPAEPTGEEVPEWLSEAEMPLAEPRSGTTQELPEWLAEMDEVAQEQPAELVPPSPAPPVEQPAEEEGLEQAPILGDTKPTRISREPPPEAPQPVAPALEAVEPGVSLEESDDAFAWLESLAVKQGASEALLLTPEERRETPPDWVQEQVSSAAEAAAEVAEEEPSPEAGAVGAGIATAGAALVGGMIAAGKEELQQPVAGIEEPQAPVEEVAVPSMMDEDATFAWLESLAVKQGASEALLLTPEERLETPPDWVLEQAALEAEKSVVEQPPIVEAPAEEMVVPEEAAVQEPEPLWAEAPGEIAPDMAEAPLAGAELELEEPSPAEEAAPELVEPAVEAQIAEVSAEAEAAPPLPFAEELPELPSWLLETAPEPVEEIEWAPPAEAVAPRLELNSASLSELERLPGVGFIMAQQIVSHREHHGAFRQLDDLLDVPGVTQFTLGQIQDLLYVEVPEEAPALPAEEYPVPEGEEQLPLELVEARRRLQSGALPLAMEIYANLIAAEQHLPMVIQDLEGASERYPDDFNVWQSLGDAYFRADSIQEALKAYTKAEQLL